MINWCLTLAHNNLDLTRRCVASLYMQDIPTSVMVVDNGSTDGTEDWLRAGGNVDAFSLLGSNRGVSYGWNFGLGFLFEEERADQVLVVGNDTILANWTYASLLATGVPFVTGVDIGMDPLPDEPDIFPLSPHPDFSCFLIRSDCWVKLGSFNEAMVNYVSDCEMHVRAHRLGMPLWKASVPFNHQRSSTTNRAPMDECKALHEQANRDREVFRSIYSCLPGTKEYEDLFLEVPK